MKELVHNLLQLQELEFADAGDSHRDATISKLRQKIPPPILDHYDRLTDQGKRGVAAVRHQVCMGCHMRIPIGAIITLMHEADIQLCGNCGRYLYLPSDAHNELVEVCVEAKATGSSRSPKRKPLTRAL